MIESGGPVLALVALVAIAWARRQDNQVRRKARHLQWRNICRRPERKRDLGLA
jgi:hypothetical protein